MPFSEKEWPSWPADEEGTVIMCIDVDKPVEEVFQLIHGGLNEFRQRVNDVSKVQNFSSSGWQASVEEAFSAAPSTASTVDVASLKPGTAAKTSFLVPSMGKMCQTQEVSKVTVVEPGVRIVLDSTVCTAAKYGDKFRPVSRRTFEALGPGRTRVSNLAAVVFVTSVNGMIKGMIRKGAVDGMRAATATMVEVLKTVATVTSPEAAAEAAVPAAAEKPLVVLRPASAAAAEAASTVRRTLDSAFGSVAVRILEPWAAFLHAAVAHQPLLHGATVDSVLAVLAAVIAVEALRLGLAVLRFGQSAGREPSDILTWLAHYAFKLIYVPSGVLEVLSTMAIVLAVRWAVNRTAAALPWPPSSGPGGSGRESPDSAVGGAGAGGGAPLVEEESEALSGVKYDGYKQAIASAAEKNYMGRRGGGARLHTRKTLDERSEAALESIRKGVDRLCDSGPLVKPILHNRKKHHGKHGQHGDEGHAEQEEHAQHAIADGGNGSIPPAAGEAAAAPAGVAAPAANDHQQQQQEEPLSKKSYSSPDLAPELRQHAVVVSVFENERLQPFRGWGHTWPGHFLPTDKVSHWSLIDSYGDDVACSQSLAEVAPPLPPGWRWVEEDGWKLDLSGAKADCTDGQGWSYALDFPWFRFPFPPGSGKKRMADFVRRRRWLRTRVPISPPPSPTRLSEGESSSSSAPAIQEVAAAMAATTGLATEIIKNEGQEEAESSPAVVSLTSSGGSSPTAAAVAGILPPLPSMELPDEDDVEEEEEEEGRAGEVVTPSPAETASKGSKSMGVEADSAAEDKEEEKEENKTGDREKNEEPVLPEEAAPPVASKVAK